MDKDEYIGFRLPKELKDKFWNKHPSKAARSRIIRGLLQLYLDGKLPPIKFISTEEYRI